MALYTQSSQRLEIIIRKVDSTQAVPPPENNPSQEETTQPSEQQTETSSTGGDGKKKSSKINARTQRIWAERITATTVQIAGMMKNYAISGVGYRHGDSALQQSVQRTTEIVTDVAGFGKSVAMGGIMGASGGPIGVAIGMTCALASQTASIIDKYATRNRDYNVKMFKEENSLNYKINRANINLTTGRLR